MIPALEDIRFTADNQKPFKSVPAQPVKLTLEPLSNFTRATTDEIRNSCTDRRSSCTFVTSWTLWEWNVRVLDIQ